MPAAVPRHIARYLAKYALEEKILTPGNLVGIDQAVAIPVLAEKDHLFFTLAALARNPEPDIRRTLVVCVVNNRRPHRVPRAVIEDNRRTLLALHALVQGRIPHEPAPDASWARCFREIHARGLRIACIDASSPGNEMPDKEGGVGRARKMAMDASLRVFDYSIPTQKIIFCLDADTLVEGNYLSAVRASFEQEGIEAAVVPFEHRDVPDPLHRTAVRCYEIFLRYYVLGLAYAGSPYAFHTVGSTMVCTADSYAAVRGMNTRDAAEDFYFLTKLAKVAKIGTIRTTRVYPSARRSARVPFGTGRQMIRFLDEGGQELLFYDPRVFRVLKDWLAMISCSLSREGRELECLAEGIDPRLGAFLRSKGFAAAWDRIGKNCRDEAVLRRHFSSWFDGFKTLKLIHHLTDAGYPRMGMFEAVGGLLGMMKRDVLRG